jgi:hypothetical protein
MTHGGKRKGAGRKPHHDKVERATFYIGQSQRIWLDEYTSRFGHTSVSASLREILYEQQLKSFT